MQSESIQLKNADQSFWDEYQTLWNHSVCPSPYQSPNYARYLAKRELELGWEPIAIAGRENNKLVCIYFLKKKNSTFLNLAFGASDHHIIIIKKGFNNLEKLIDWMTSFMTNENKSKFNFTKVPQWGYQSEIISKAAENAGFNSWRLSNTLDPLLILNPKDPQEQFNKEVDNKKLKYYSRRLKKEESFEFEVLNGPENLDDWAEDFANSHEWRWNFTETPSMFISPVKRQDLKNKLSAWAADGCLRCFAIKINNERIAFCLGLAQSNRIVYHFISHLPKYHKYSAGKALIRELLIWMIENGYNELDFGTGNESYKDKFANQIDHLDKFYLAKGFDLKFWLIQKVEYFVKVNEKREELYTKWSIKARDLKGRLNGKVSSRASSADSNSVPQRDVYYRIESLQQAIKLNGKGLNLSVFMNVLNQEFPNAHPKLRLIWIEFYFSAHPEFIVTKNDKGESQMNVIVTNPENEERILIDQFITKKHISELSSLEPVEIVLDKRIGERTEAKTICFSYSFYGIMIGEPQ